MKHECAFCFSNFLIIGLHSSSANSLFSVAYLSGVDKFSYLAHITTPTAVFLSKNL